MSPNHTSSLLIEFKYPDMFIYYFKSQFPQKGSRCPNIPGETWCRLEMTCVHRCLLSWLRPLLLLFVSALFYSCCAFLSSLSPVFPPPLSPGQTSLAPWGPMRRPSWLMCHVTTTRSQASRRWGTKSKLKRSRTSPDHETKPATVCL